MSVWGQRWGQGLIGPDDLDPKMLLWGMRRQIIALVPISTFISTRAGIFLTLHICAGHRRWHGQCAG
jgi:hypothetical protein